MSSDDLNKSLSESSRALAKAFIIWGLESLDRVQEFSHQAQEYMQDLVAEAKQEQQAASETNNKDDEPHYKQAEAPASTRSRKQGAGEKRESPS